MCSTVPIGEVWCGSSPLPPSQVRPVRCFEFGARSRKTEERCGRHLLRGLSTVGLSVSTLHLATAVQVLVLLRFLDFLMDLNRGIMYLLKKSILIGSSRLRKPRLGEFCLTGVLMITGAFHSWIYCALSTRDHKNPCSVELAINGRGEFP